jgi:hypothetical protein
MSKIRTTKNTIWEEFGIVKLLLKIPKGQPESVYRRRTDKTMTKRNSPKEQTTIYKTYTSCQCQKYVQRKTQFITKYAYIHEIGQTYDSTFVFVFICC